MNEINLDFIDRLEKILKWKQWSIGKIENNFDANALYTTLFSTMYLNTIRIPRTSMFNIFKLLGATPHTTDKEDRDSEYLKNNFKFYNTPKENTPLAYTRIDDPEKFLGEALANMIEFINLSCYIYNKLGYEKKTKMQKDMLKLLIVSASTIYDELYSKRGKIAFAYYFKKILLNNKDLSKKITPYNKKSWKSKFSKFTREAKEGINSLLGGKDISKPFIIDNIAIVCGKMTDQDLVPLKEKYFIEAGIVDYKQQDYNRIFITTFL